MRRENIGGAQTAFAEEKDGKPGHRLCSSAKTDSLSGCAGLETQSTHSARARDSIKSVTAVRRRPASTLPSASTARAFSVPEWAKLRVARTSPVHSSNVGHFGGGVWRQSAFVRSH